MFKIIIENSEGPTVIKETAGFHLVTENKGEIGSSCNFPNTPLLITLLLNEIDRLKDTMFNAPKETSPFIVPANIIPFPENNT